MRIALVEIDEVPSHQAVLRATRGKLFLVLPRLLLHRSPRGGKIPKSAVSNSSFSRGEWASLLASEQESSAHGAPSFARRQRRPAHDDVEQGCSDRGVGAHG